MEKEEVGKRIKAGRRVYETIFDEKLTQDILAEKTGLSRSYIGDIESGRTYPTLSALYGISNVLQIPIEYFVSENFLLKNYLFGKEHTKPIENDFSSDEIKLLADFRSLPPNYKSVLLSSLESLERLVEDERAKKEQSSTKEVG